ncbi:hypothetical protein [Microbulbifer variabilis]|uniref:hypothetical protein n=1 Tax=Microbulbifer variabilis TaxID=266805 RepID=UPI001CFE7E4B|nr:hypothetical protein [Microbulbifer variabilis]
MSKKFVEYPDLEALPSEGAVLSDYDRFARSFDPTGAFRELWGKDYVNKAMDLWLFVISEFDEKKVSSSSVEELLLSINYNFAIGPYLGAVESPLPFCEWLISAIRSKLRDIE